MTRSGEGRRAWLRTGGILVPLLLAVAGCGPKGTAILVKVNIDSADVGSLDGRVDELVITMEQEALKMVEIIKGQREKEPGA